MIHPKEVPPEAILLAVYLELQNGKSLQSVDFQSAQSFGVSAISLQIQTQDKACWSVPRIKALER